MRELPLPPLINPLIIMKLTELQQNQVSVVTDWFKQKEILKNKLHTVEMQIALFQQTCEHVNKHIGRNHHDHVYVCTICHLQTKSATYEK